MSEYLAIGLFVGSMALILGLVKLCEALLPRDGSSSSHSPPAGTGGAR